MRRRAMCVSTAPVTTRDSFTRCTVPERIARAAQMLRAPLLVLLLGGCAALNRGFLNAAGPIAGGECHLFLIIAVVLLFVAGPVLILTPILAWHYRLSNTHKASWLVRKPRLDHRRLEIGQFKTTTHLQGFFPEP